MKKLCLFLCLLGLVALPALAQINGGAEADSSAQYKATGSLAVRFWHLGIYPFADGKAPAEIAKVVDNGLYPTGIEVTSGDQLTILYARLLGMPGKEVAIKIITDLGSVNQAIQKDIIDQGYIPMDLAVTGKGILVLYLKSPVKITEWRLFRVKGDGLPAFQPEAQKYVNQGFAMLGMSYYDGNIWGLMLKTDKPLFAGSEIKGYKNDGQGFIQGLEFQASTGSLPMGFMIVNDLVYCNFSRGK